MKRRRVERPDDMTQLWSAKCLAALASCCVLMARLAGAPIQIDARPVEYFLIDTTPAQRQIVSGKQVEYLALSNSPGPTPIHSWPVQYVETSPLPWSLARTTLSAPVSYHVTETVLGPESIVTGTVVSRSGSPLTGVRILASLGQLPIATAWTGPDGSFRLPPVPHGIYAVVATLPGYAPAGVTTDFRDGTLPQNFVLAALPPPPAVESVTDPISEAQRPRTARVSSTQLRVFEGGQWVTGGTIHLDRISMVMTHGWIFCGQEGGIGGWPRSLAQTIHDAGYANRLNILAWEWEEDARNCLIGSDGAVLPPVDRTPAQGIALAQALERTFGGSPSRPVHFLGHSLGTLVHASAVNYLHGDGPTSRTRSSNPWNPDLTHVTLFDEAEVAVIAGSRALGGATKGFATGALHSNGSLAIAAAMAAFGWVDEAINDWRNPIPVRSAWTDNYISLVGLVHPNTVNVCLQIDSLDNLGAAHSVPMEWYARTVADPTQAQLGFTNTFLHHDHLPPTGSGLFAGRVFVQASEADRLLLREAADNDFTQLQQEMLKLLADRAATAVVDTIHAGVRAAGQVVARTTAWTAQNPELVIDALATLNPMMASLPTIALDLSTTVRKGRNGIALPQDGTGDSTGQPAYAWIRLDVPKSAAFLQFDFIVNGDGADDSIVCGINGTNRFSLETKFVAPGIRTSSPRIDVSNLAGTEVEVFLGILGGTSTSCTATVEGLRFISLASPKLSVGQPDSSSVILSWPVAAEGFVLEQAEAPQSALWDPVSTIPLVNNGSYEVRAELTGANRFFRLRRR